jgi:hypothetical protein
MVVYGNLLIGNACESHQVVEVNTVGSAHSPGLDAETTLAPDGSLSIRVARAARLTVGQP